MVVICLPSASQPPTGVTRTMHSAAIPPPPSETSAAVRPYLQLPDDVAEFGCRPSCHVMLCHTTPSFVHVPCQIFILETRKCPARREQRRDGPACKKTPTRKLPTSRRVKGSAATPPMPCILWCATTGKCQQVHVEKRLASLAHRLSRRLRDTGRGWRGLTPPTCSCRYSRPHGASLQ